MRKWGHFPICICHLLSGRWPVSVINCMVRTYSTSTATHDIFCTCSPGTPVDNQVGGHSTCCFVMQMIICLVSRLSLLSVQLQTTYTHGSIVETHYSTGTVHTYVRSQSWAREHSRQLLKKLFMAKTSSSIHQTAVHVYYVQSTYVCICMYVNTYTYVAMITDDY